ncbi:MAG TPA: tetratricopeptide repeat protein, partial [Candidatus Cybelea sp.]|nr:tetratricopeptide repeat protein [Candidatus Cybelea sp.]
MDRLEDALASYDRAVALAPDHADTLDNRGVVLAALMRLDEALASFDRAVALRPDHANAFNNRGKTLADLKRLPDAIASFDRAITLKPDYADAFNNRGIALRDLERHAEALASFDRAKAMKPDLKYLAGARLLSKMHICDWSDFATSQASVLAAVSDGVAAALPFVLVATPATPSEQRRCAELYVADRYPPAAALARRSARPHDRIRLAYLSADFHDHATAVLMAGLFERHDRSRFEPFAVSFGPARDDAMRQRLTRSFDRFIDVRMKTDQAIAEHVRDLEIDIAIDLKGFTQDARPGVLAKRPAPVQVNYLGFPATMGAPYIHYIIADRFVIPDDRCDAYAEKVVHLPDSYQPNDRDRVISERAPLRADAGLPETGLVLCSFNNNFKITPDVFDIWMRLLREIDR